MHPILVVDDDISYRTYLFDALAREGVVALTAPTAKTALTIMKTTPVGGLVTDILMPEMDGIELVRAVRRSHPNLPILALSADGAVVADVYLKAAQAVGATFVGRKGPDDVVLLRDLLAVVNFRHHLKRRTETS